MNMYTNLTNFLVFFEQIDRYIYHHHSMALYQIIQACQNETYFDELCYLQQVLGPQRQPWNTLIPLTCVYLVLAILGIFGNLSVCFVIFRIPSMRSATNYYLFSLAIADLLILLLGKL